MSRRAARLGLVALLVATLATVTACSAATPDESAATTEAPATTTTAVPTGTPEELLPLMLAEVESLSAKVSAGDGDGAAASRIEQLWANIAEQVAAARPELVEDFEFVVSRCRLAADRNRPADADRAFRNLTTLVASYLA